MTTDSKMRAKIRVTAVIPTTNGGEVLHFGGVGKNNYDMDGADEDNTYAKFTPSLTQQVHIVNPDLVGTFEVNDMFYLDFIPVPK